MKYLDRTVAWVVACVTILALVAVSWLGGNYRYAQETERKALEAGKCQVQNVAGAGIGYHWEKCP